MILHRNTSFDLWYASVDAIYAQRGGYEACGLIFNVFYLSFRIGSKLVTQNCLNSSNAYFNLNQDSVGNSHLQEIG